MLSLGHSRFEIRTVCLEPFPRWRLVFTRTGLFQCWGKAPQRAFAELQERGFIELVTKGAFSRKSPHASEWRLTFNTCDVTGELASKAFMRWGREKQNAVSKYSVAVSNQSHRAA